MKIKVSIGTLLLFVSFSFLSCDTTNVDISDSEFIIPFEEGKTWYYETKAYENGELYLSRKDSLIISETVNELGRTGWRIDPTSSTRLGFGDMVLAGGKDSLFIRYQTIIEGIYDVALIYLFPESKTDSVEFFTWMLDSGTFWQGYQTENPTSNNITYVFETSRNPEIDGNSYVKVEEGVGIIEYNNAGFSEGNEILVTQTLIRDQSEIE